MDTINLIYPEQNATDDFAELVENLNSYLKNTVEIGPDISVMKEMIDQQSNMMEENVSSTLFTPMYFGLMGTFTGIIFGVSGMALFGEFNNNFEHAVKYLLIGVGIAMFSSLIGLILSVINSFVNFQKAKLQFDKGKIRFTNFIQSELLPLNIKHDNSSIASLNYSIKNFNTSFNEKLNKLGNYLEKNMDNFKIQEALLDKFDKINLKQVTEANIKLLDNFSKSTDNLSLLNDSLNNVNAFVTESASLSNEANQLFSRFKNFEKNSEKIADEINNKIDLSNELLEFLKMHFSELQKYGQLTRNAVGSVDQIVGDAIEDLKTTIVEKQQVFRTSIGSIDENIVQALKELETHLESALSTLVKQTDEQSNFIGNAHEIAVKKYDEKLDEISKSINEKIELLHKIANEETIRLENVVNENKISLSKLSNLETIKNTTIEVSSNTQELIRLIQKSKSRSKGQGLNGREKPTKRKSWIQRQFKKIPFLHKMNKSSTIN
ncbi:hypothetical protein IH575_03665 [Candidatus Dojkabacteria bacterium]|nr:hypothetical protein [Candidatus Dojkabacteria bacterium]